ncbi:putative cobalt transporter CbtA [Rubellimicrobium mesophilum DSM 19309]|uniref:Putative cobalt transporter CbtA n=1 Tax=Rubellimicrobium mesophilum DSM 19309 TaxID=442562 RepID=A0A017HHK7_9RHOB|nr:CbtA family protein [Rubellimicrobium mesophilum]EYD73977.1 putative cobalt transporter CbtA [Rubellimicrobium mesophilum DSM 19309]
MTSRILTGALIAGLAAGFLAALLNLWMLTPLILEAEVFEGAAGHTHAGEAETHTHEDGTEHAHEATEEPGGLARTFGTVTMTLVAYAGFGLVLGAAMSAAARTGHRIDARAGLLWGFAGFAAVQLAPAVGLPPELPGMEAAGLGARQAWWVLCVGFTALGLAAMAFGRGLPWLAVGAVLILLPHAFGAPQPPTHDGLVPPGLAAAFATRSLGVAALSWAFLGVLSGALSERAPARRTA